MQELSHAREGRFDHLVLNGFPFFIIKIYNDHLAFYTGSIDFSGHSGYKNLSKVTLTVTLGTITVDSVCLFGDKHYLGPVHLSHMRKYL